jgi:cytochrome d ubiquinol oxidase subunit II
MAGVTLLAAFPVAYAILLPALYLPVIIMLLALGFRGVSFEFRVQTKRHRRQWDLAFGIGSAIAAFMQGIILGGLIQGVKVEDLRFAGSVLDVFRPLPILIGVTLVAGYAVLGCGWLYLKADALLERFAVRCLRTATLALVAFSCIVCIYAVKIQPGVRLAWALHRIAFPILVGLFALVSIGLTMVTKRSRAGLPLTLGLLLFATSMSGMALVIFPNIVPFHVSLWTAASSSASQRFVLIGATFVTPVVLAYSAFAYWIFRGRTPAKGWGD